MIKQNPLTLVTRIEIKNLQKLKDILDELKVDLEKGKHELFEKSLNIHYLRWIIIDDSTSIFFKDTERHPQLVFSSNFDGNVKDHLKDLCGADENRLIDSIYSCCEGYGKNEKQSVESRMAYLKKCDVGVSAFYKGSPGRSVKQILKERDLRLHLRDLLDSGSWEKKKPKQVHRELRKKVFDNPEFSWAKKGYRMPRTNYFKMILLVLTLLVLSPVIIIWILIVQFGHESKDEYFDKTRSDLDEDKVKILENYEDLVNPTGVKNICYQNQFSQLVDMKEGWVWLVTFKAMMLFARTLIPIKFVDGELMGIPTIHFARWVLFDDNKRVLFFSNFDGSWQQYLGDFIDQSGWGLTGIFSNTKMFPKTRFLFTGGAYDEEHFLAWSRNSELPTAIWYSAYPKLSIKNVNNNSRIRSMLSLNLSNKRAKQFFEII